MIPAGADDGLQGSVAALFLVPKNGGLPLLAAAVGGQVMSRAEVDEGLERLRAEEDEISAALLEVEDHPGYRLLNGAALTGLTLERWTTAKTVIGTLREGLAAHKETVQAGSRPQGQASASGRGGACRTDQAADRSIGRADRPGNPA